MWKWPKAKKREKNNKKPTLTMQHNYIHKSKVIKLRDKLVCLGLMATFIYRFRLLFSQLTDFYHWFIHSFIHSYSSSSSSSSFVIRSLVRLLNLLLLRRHVHSIWTVPHFACAKFYTFMSTYVIRSTSWTSEYDVH